jgi:uncharacterized membrane protein required for colicin V production
MTIWILALVLLASLAGLGYRQGAIRTAFSLVGIVVAGLLAAPLGKLMAPLLPHLGVHNPTLIWLAAPLEAFVILLILFKTAGFFVYRKTELYYKYKAGDLRLALWERLNHRLGLCIGLLNGTAYFVLVSMVIYNFSYWTVQVAPADNGAKTTRFINQLGRDLESTGLDGAARAVDPMPEVYYKLADLAGLLCQNPALGDRLASYPVFLSLVERDEFQQLAQDSGFTNAWNQQAPVGQLLDNPQVKAMLENKDLLDMVWGIVQTNLDDLLVYLKTGQSPKYDPEKILGRWDFNASATFVATLRAHPSMLSSEMKRARVWLTTAYADTLLIVAPDHQAFLKNLPHLKAEKGQPPAIEKLNFRGNWEEDGTNYDLSLTDASNKGKSQSLKAHFEDGRLTITSREELLVFQRED